MGSYLINDHQKKTSPHIWPLYPQSITIYTAGLGPAGTPRSESVGGTSHQAGKLSDTWGCQR